MRTPRVLALAVLVLAVGAAPAAATIGKRIDVSPAGAAAVTGPMSFIGPSTREICTAALQLNFNGVTIEGSDLTEIGRLVSGTLTNCAGSGGTGRVLAPADIIVLLEPVAAGAAIPIAILGFGVSFSYTFTTCLYRAFVLGTISGDGTGIYDRFTISRTSMVLQSGVFCDASMNVTSPLILTPDQAISVR